MSNITIVKLKQCVFCDRPPDTMEVSAKGFKEWQAGELIQNAFPQLLDSERELLITGTHDECWDRVFKE